jgi:hypothetical protein
MLTHELMHKFDHYKNPKEYAGNHAEYTAIQKVGIKDLTPVNTFMHLLYFTHDIERVTRSSEFYSQLKVKNITKKDFKQFFEDSELINTLKECRDYTFGKLVSELHGYMPAIDGFLQEVKASDADIGREVDLEGTDINKINMALKLVFKILINAKINVFFNLFQDQVDPFQSLFNPNEAEKQREETQQYVDNFMKKVKKYDNYSDFFGNEIKRLNFVGDKTIKKLSKLYDMVDDDKQSIVNWDLHHKINKTAEKTRERLNELISDKIPRIVKKKD